MDWVGYHQLAEEIVQVKTEPTADQGIINVIIKIGIKMRGTTEDMNVVIARSHHTNKMSVFGTVRIEEDKAAINLKRHH